jgi:2-polyprenyl-3-methyl-5-hydroxy-6-metoxy-1,4-benzoquinol methylase
MLNITNLNYVAALVAAGREQYYQRLEYLESLLRQFVAERPEVPVSTSDKLRTYTTSPQYLAYCAQYHQSPDVAQFLLTVAGLIQPGDSLVDVGCCAGFTGLMLAGYDKYPVTFHDYGGIGLDFLRWVLANHDYPQTRVIPYHQPIEPHKWVVACDVLEHTGNHLATLRWLSELSSYGVVLCYPTAPAFAPPYVTDRLDEWVDDEAIQWVIERRYKVITSYIEETRRYTIYEV